MVSRPHFQRFVERVRNLPALPTAVVYPCDRDSLQLALSGQFANYLAPILVGPEARIADAAAQGGLDGRRGAPSLFSDAAHGANLRSVVVRGTAQH